MSVRQNSPSPRKGEVGAKRRVGVERCFSRTRSKTTLARTLRHNMTEAEKKLWSRLRQNQMESLSFRRQHPIGNYIVDFWCSAVKLVIELDGGQHNHPVSREKDAVRTKNLENRGITVLRFWNPGVMKNVEGVLATVRETVLDLQSQKQTPTLTLPPAGGGNLREVDR